MILGTFKTGSGTEVSAKTLAESVVVTHDGNEYPLSDVLAALMADPVETVEVAATEIAAATAYTVPQYIVGCCHISVYLNGMKLACGERGAFVEVCDNDAASTTMHVTDVVPSGTEIIVRVGR